MNKSNSKAYFENKLPETTRHSTQVQLRFLFYFCVNFGSSSLRFLFYFLFLLLCQLVLLNSF